MNLIPAEYVNNTLINGYPRGLYLQSISNKGIVKGYCANVKIRKDDESSLLRALCKLYLIISRTIKEYSDIPEAVAVGYNYTARLELNKLSRCTSISITDQNGKLVGRAMQFKNMYNENVKLSAVFHALKKTPLYELYTTDTSLAFDDIQVSTLLNAFVLSELRANEVVRIANNAITVANETTTTTTKKAEKTA